MAAKKRPSRPKPLDVPPAIVDLRLRELAQLYKLGMKLRDVRWIDPPPKPNSESNPT